MIQLFILFVQVPFLNIFIVVFVMYFLMIQCELIVGIFMWNYRHTFCFECIQNWISHLPQTRLVCPTCNKKIRKTSINRDQIAYNVIGEIEVYCSNIDQGCLWKGQISELNQHLKDCVYGSANLPQWLMYSVKENYCGKSEKENDSDKHKPSALTLELLKDKGIKGIYVIFK